MAKRSAVHTHPYGNRRYEGFLLTLHGSRVERVYRFDPTTDEVVLDDLTLKEMAQGGAGNGSVLQQGSRDDD